MNKSNHNNNLVIALLTISFLSATAQQWYKNPIINKIRPPLSIDFLLRLSRLSRDVRNNGCDIKVCFALQGDDFITDQEFEYQKSFVDLIVSIISSDRNAQFCAIQFGNTTHPISPLTSRKFRFRRKLRSQMRIGGLDTDIADSLGFVGFQLATPDEAIRKLIIIGDDFGKLRLKPRRIARRLREKGVGISAVTFDGSDNVALKSIVGDDLNNILETEDFFELNQLIVGLVIDLCGFRDRYFFF